MCEVVTLSLWHYLTGMVLQPYVHLDRDPKRTSDHSRRHPQAARPPARAACRLRDRRKPSGSGAARRRRHGAIWAGERPKERVARRNGASDPVTLSAMIAVD